MKQIPDYLVYVLVRLVFGLLGVLPQDLRVSLCGALFRMAFAVVPRLRTTAMRNLEIAFPESSDEWRREIIAKNCLEMGRLLADVVRLPSLTPEWVRNHVSCPVLERYATVLGEQDGKGILIATGHLGSFELLGHAIGLFGYPLSAIARRFRSPVLDRWWMGLREARGNTIIDRKGAFKEMVSTLLKGRSVAVLFDQNVTRNHAVFPKWFGKPAATTRSVALAALRTEVPIFVASMRYCGDDRYTVEAVECDCSDVYRDQALSMDEKVDLITQRLSDHYCCMIASFPEGWFWLHRRWKTRPENEQEGVY
jgi:KDO2-lipid IV(A) lauroyltransferase